MFLFSGFVSATEGGTFFDPINFVFAYIQAHDIEFLIGTLILSMAAFGWWRKVNGWV